MGLSGQLHAPAASTPGKEPRYPLSWPRAQKMSTGEMLALNNATNLVLQSLVSSRTETARYFVSYRIRMICLTLH
jgi:hypothetical protein